MDDDEERVLSASRGRSDHQAPMTIASLGDRKGRRDDEGHERRHHEGGHHRELRWRTRHDSVAAGCWSSSAENCESDAAAAAAEPPRYRAMQPALGLGTVSASVSDRAFPSRFPFSVRCRPKRRCTVQGKSTRYEACTFRTNVLRSERRTSFMSELDVLIPLRVTSNESRIRHPTGHSSRFQSSFPHCEGQANDDGGTPFHRGNGSPRDGDEVSVVRDAGARVASCGP